MKTLENNAWVAPLLQVSDPLFPTGGYAHSLGFEQWAYENEYNSKEDIKQFCTLNYGVTFPMSSKVSVRGKDQDPLFGYLTSQPNQDFEGGIRWNFEKFLIDKDGKLQRRFRSGVEPESEELTSAIEALL